MKSIAVAIVLAAIPFVWSAGDSIRIDGVHLSSLGLGE